MHENNVASSSRHTFEEVWDIPPQTSPFPTSDLRSGLGVARCATLPSISTWPRGKLATSEETPSGYSISSTHSTSVPRRTQIELGVWSDGTDRVLSATHIEVQDFIAHARRTMNLPVTHSETVFTLAALEVFYSPGDPVHWMFWSDERKHQTAEVVNRISLHRPQLIQSRVAWNGTPEYLSILANHHGSTWRQLYETTDWFPILVPLKISTGARIPNLRKRKPAQMDLREPSASPTEETMDTEQPAVKRPKTERVASHKNSTPNEIPSQHIQGIPESITVNMPPTTASTSLPREDNPLLGVQPVEQPREAIYQPDPVLDKENPVPARVSARQRRRKAVKSSPPPELQPSQASSSSLASTPSSPPALSHSRNRSASQASAQTLVTSGRRSLSVLSASTAVEIPNGKKGRIVEIPVGQEATDPENTEDKYKTSAMDTHTLGMVTRRRARDIVMEKARLPRVT